MDADVVEQGRSSVAGIALVAALLTLVPVTVAVSEVEGSSVGTPWRSVGSTQTLPPWPAPKDPALGERAAGLTVLPGEGVTQHIHAHLDIVVDGATVSVPEHLGIDVRRGLYAQLHTHADSGVLHIESADRNARFGLGQLFTEWGVRLDANHLGALSSADGRRLYVFLNGGEVRGDPARIRLADHQEIVLAYGTQPPAEVPASFDFAATPT